MNLKTTFHISIKNTQIITFLIQKYLNKLQSRFFLYIFFHLTLFLIFILFLLKKKRNIINKIIFIVIIMILNILLMHILKLKRKITSFLILNSISIKS